MRLTDKAQGFFVHGHLDDITKLKNYRVSLAPLRFGAGIKGKISDSWHHGGTPCVTTLIGHEGMSDVSNDFENWGGLVATSDDLANEFATKAIELYTNEQTWKTKQTNAFRLLNKLFDRDQNRASFVDNLRQLYENISTKRIQDIVGNIMWQSNVRATEYMSKFIELKQKMQKK
jgi:glycosyltransferase involved in cell wall biosynthesis